LVPLLLFLLGIPPNLKSVNNKVFISNLRINAINHFAAKYANYLAK